MLSGSCNCAHFDDVPRLLRRRLRGCRSQVQVPCIAGDCRCHHAFSGAGAAACTWTMCGPHFFDTLAGWASRTDRVERPAAPPHPVRWGLLHQQVRQTSSTPCSVGPLAPTGSRGLLLFHILFGWASRTNRFDRPLRHPVRLGHLHQQGQEACFSSTSCSVGPLAPTGLTDLFDTLFGWASCTNRVEMRSSESVCHVGAKMR